ncbi:uncharacterized protein LOC126056169 isoform X2 [Helicoverpa armigera]|uniref:uncharacterized protein LOC126056169 isoform X2 n=1 Tax=Helicoverpa armigera TaxID=29058 RepID=UPI003083CC03
MGKPPGRQTSVLWNYYDKDPQCATKAICRFCNNSYSFSTTTANLRSHLKRVHTEEYVNINWNGKFENEADETDELLMLTGVWSYFEAEDKKARCELCGTSLPDDYEELKAHLGEHHPETLLNIMQKKEKREKAERSDNDDGQDQDNMTYTEIVYLEQDTSDSTDSIPEKPKPKPKPSPKTVKIKTVKRRESTLTSDDIPMKRQKNCQSDVDNNELDAFIKYVTCLLKKLPENVFSEVQGEIISCIMRANSRISQSSASLSSQSVSSNKNSGVNNANNLVTVSEITPVNNALGHNFSIVVAPKETDSGT